MKEAGSNRGETRSETRASVASVAGLDRALATSRADLQRCVEFERVAIRAAIALLTAAALRGAAAMIWVQDRRPAQGAAAAVGSAIAIAIALLFAARRARATVVRARPDVLALELAREAVAHEAMPSVELHPYREDGPLGPVIVVRGLSDDALRAAGSPPPAPARAPAPTRLSSPRLARVVASIAVTAAIALLAGMLVGEGSAASQRWTFLDGSTPSEIGLTLHGGRSGDWTLEDHAPATGGRALVNHEGDRGAAPSLVVATTSHARDLRVATRCKVSETSGGHDACGLVFRFRDADNYHLARLDVSARIVDIAVVAGGRERLIGRAPAAVAPGVWQELTVDARGTVLRASLNGRNVLDVTDVAPASAGAVGLWAPAPAKAYFDELTIEIGRRSS